MTEKLFTGTLNKNQNKHLQVESTPAQVIVVDNIENPREVTSSSQIQNKSKTILRNSKTFSVPIAYLKEV